MSAKKWIALGVGVLALTAMSSRADLGFQYSSKGTYLPGGDFTNGPFPVPGSLYQIIWSSVDPGISGSQAYYDDQIPSLIPDPGVAPGTEYVVFSAPQDSYGYVYASPLVVVTPAQIGGADPQDGFLYARLFETPDPVNDEAYYQTAPLATAGLPNYVPTDPSSQFSWEAPAAGSEMGRVVQLIPEPNTIMLLGLSALVLAVRRRMQD